MFRNNDGHTKRKLICRKFGIEKEDFEDLLRELYLDKQLSGEEISELIEREVGITYSARSVQRTIAEYGEMRSAKEAFGLAIEKGRVDWTKHWTRSERKQPQLSRKLRYEVLKKAGFKCILCGVSGRESELQVDHIIAVVHGGKNEETNLRCLCVDCNVGKREAEGENTGGWNKEIGN